MKGKRKILLKSFISTIIVSIIYFIMLKYKNINRDILTFSVVPLSYFIFSYLGNLFLINSGYSSIKIILMSSMQYKLLLNLKLSYYTPELLKMSG